MVLVSTIAIIRCYHFEAKNSSMLESLRFNGPHDRWNVPRELIARTVAVLRDNEVRERDVFPIEDRVKLRASSQRLRAMSAVVYSQPCTFEPA